MSVVSGGPLRRLTHATKSRSPMQVKSDRMARHLQRLGEIATLHPEPAVREGLREVIEQVHNRHVER